MGERDWLTRYQASRAYADEQAEAYKRGDTIENWAYETGFLPGMSAPRKVRIAATAWISHAYEIAASNARKLAKKSHDSGWNSVADECDRLAVQYRERK